MRTIKFRAYNRHENKYDTFNVDDEDDMKRWHDNRMVSLDKEMFVGKKDYSDKDIYENDYISADGYKGPVILQNNQWTVLDGYFSEDKVYKEAITINSFSSDDLIIIGSIKENPEMF